MTQGYSPFIAVSTQTGRLLSSSCIASSFEHPCKSMVIGALPKDLDVLYKFDTSPTRIGYAILPAFPRTLSSGGRLSDAATYVIFFFEFLRLLTFGADFFIVRLLRRFLISLSNGPNSSNTGVMVRECSCRYFSMSCSSVKDGGGGGFDFFFFFFPPLDFFDLLFSFFCFAFFPWFCVLSSSTSTPPTSISSPSLIPSWRRVFLPAELRNIVLPW
mmetsp:Transcript_15884/g.34369  ORF Transcript_15884/g.34369 Transcript_15884/m.34369 type:complete len:215 (-) Transcript_15884:1624-2268(-)